mmetsp:Transcript_32660/g.36536  ORF Transcript_32660/g.36536 Transcript_32660/m.36536 type:complete len:99 (-) Transcript_32660:291-587(-)
MDPVNITLELCPMYRKNPCVVHVPVLPDAWGYILSQIPGPPHTSSNPTGAFAGIDQEAKKNIIDEMQSDTQRHSNRRSKERCKFFFRSRESFTLMIMS